MRLKPMHTGGRCLWARPFLRLGPPMLALLCSSVGLYGASKPSFRKTVEIPDAGIKLKVMPRSREVPLPSPHVYRYKLTRGERSWDEDRYSPLELWVADQQIGQWKSPDNMTLRIAVVRVASSPLLSGGHIPRGDYDKRIAPVRPTTWTKEMLTAWAAAYSLANAATLKPMNASSLRILKAFEVDVPRDPAPLAYMILPSYNPLFARRNGKPWLYLELILPPDMDRLKADRAARRYLLGSCEPLSLTRLVDTAPSPNEVPPAKDSSGSVAAGSDEYTRSREAALASIRNLDDWWFDETRYYLILSNIRSQRRLLVNDLRSEMDVLQAFFRKLIPPWKPIREVSVLRAFGDEADYQDYVGKALEWSNGVWIPSRRELAIRPSNWGSSHQQREMTMRIVRHEGLHQYLYYALGKVETGVWFNEGHATLFEAVDIGRDSIRFVEAPRKAALLANLAIKRSLTPSRLFRMSYPNFYSDDKDARERNYAEAWGLIYYLRKAAPLSSPTGTDKIIGTYLDVLQHDDVNSNPRAIHMALEPVDLDALDADFNAFWTSRSRRSAALRNPALKE